MQEKESSEIVKVVDLVNNESQENKSTKLVAKEEPSLGEHEKAEHIIVDAKKIIEDAETQVTECMLILNDDLKSFKESRKSLKKDSLDKSEALLKKLGFDSDMISEDKNEKVEFGYKEQDETEKVDIKSVSSGKFTSFLISIIIGVIVTISFLLFASSALKIDFDFSKMQDISYLEPLLVWVGQLFSASANMLMGVGVLAVITLLVMYIIYIIRVSLRASFNLREAKNSHEQAEFYCTKKDECKKEIERVDAHITEVVKTLDVYRIFLGEQNSKLERILFIEERQHDFDSYHYKSQMIIEATQILVDSINNMLSVPMSKGGMLSIESEEALFQTKTVVNSFAKKTYDKSIEDIL